MKLSNKDLRLMFEEERNREGISGDRIQSKAEAAGWFFGSTVAFIILIIAALSKAGV